MKVESFIGKLQDLTKDISHSQEYAKRSQSGKRKTRGSAQMDPVLPRTLEQTK